MNCGEKCLGKHQSAWVSTKVLFLSGAGQADESATITFTQYPHECREFVRFYALSFPPINGPLLWPPSESITMRKNARERTVKWQLADELWRKVLFLSGAGQSDESATITFAQYPHECREFVRFVRNAPTTKLEQRKADGVDSNHLFTVWLYLVFLRNRPDDRLG